MTRIHYELGVRPLDKHEGQVAAGATAVVDAIAEALPYVARYAGKTIVVKIGGSTLGSHDTTLEDLVILQQLGVKVVLVHGGGAVISTWLRKVGKEPVFVNGLRVTDEETMEVVLMSLCGLVNKDLVSSIQAIGGRAVGLSGLDGGLMRGVRKNESLGLVGKVTEVNLEPLEALMGAGFLPVIAPIALGKSQVEGSQRPGVEALNLNADTAAAEVAVALGAQKLIFLTDVPGVKGADGEVITEIKAADTHALIASGVVSGGMIPKVEACLRALTGGGQSHIIDGRQPHALIRELFTDSGVGTMIRE